MPVWQNERTVEMKQALEGRAGPPAVFVRVIERTAGLSARISSDGLRMGMPFQFRQDAVPHFCSGLVNGRDTDHLLRETRRNRRVIIWSCRNWRGLNEIE